MSIAGHRQSANSFFSRARNALAAAGILAAGLSQESFAQAAKPSPLSLNDISILFPPPKTEADLQRLIPLARLAGPGSARSWSEADFARFLAIAEGPSGKIVGTDHAIRLPADTKNIEAWFVAGIRIDPGAPGLSSDIIEQFGQQPQIRLIAHPVTRSSGKVTVHDFAAHLIFSFMKTNDLRQPDLLPPKLPDQCFPRPQPDDATLRAIINDAIALRDDLAAGKFGGTKVATKGKPLGVHPGLTGASAADFGAALNGFLSKYLLPQRLSSMAVMGLPNDFEPWIFVAMQKVPGPGGAPVFIDVKNPVLDGTAVAQMLSFLPVKKVLPVPANNNEVPITCRHAAIQPPQQPLPVAGRKGAATSEIFDGSANPARAKAVLQTVADPKRSHFFNTDCVSCHTETRLSMQKFPAVNFPAIAKNALPQRRWNVRNFGWFFSEFSKKTPVAPTVTRRTAEETAEAAAFINQKILGLK